MNHTRVIPVLTILDQRLVKTEKFSNPIYVGDPVNAVRIFNEKEVDELVVIDIGSTKLNRGVDFQLLKMLAEECFMPLAYGGGISSFEEVKEIFRLGVEKVIIQNKAFTNPSFVNELVRIYGSSSIIISIDVVNVNGEYFAFNYLDNSLRDKDLTTIINHFLDLGIGEFCFNLKDLDGTLSGPDIPFINQFVENITVPSIYIGGISSSYDINELIGSSISGIGIGRLFCLYGPHKAPLIRYFK